MEYNRAVERNIPRLIFFMHSDHPLKAGDVETGDGAAKLATLKKNIGEARVAGFFESADNLHSLVFQSLLDYRTLDVNTLHPPQLSDLPMPPAPYIAHPYTLLQTSQLVGRSHELNLLTDWITGKGSLQDVRLFNLVAIGGMGKSALTWKWFNDIAPQERRDLAGRFWWSFYESDASFENFVIRALAYVSGKSREECEKLSRQDREDQLLAALAQKPYLLVLDGLERILNAYARMDAARLSDDDYDKQTANYVVGAVGLPASAADSFVGQHQLRKTADPRDGAFLRKLATLNLVSRILITTRLYPSELQMVTGHPIYGCSAVFLRGLSDDDALNLWRAFGVTGSRDQLLPIFLRFENYPLLIRALAGEVARSRRANGDFDVWRKANPAFDPLKVATPVNVKAHVLDYAMRGLSEPARQVLQTLAAFRMPASYDTLAALLMGDDKPCATENALDDLLTDLEDRGLVGWDRASNRYDLHPVVRGTAWQTASADARQTVYTSLSAHFESIPVPEWQQIEHYEDLTPAVERYCALIARERYDDAEQLFYNRLSDATLYRLSASRQRAELLEMLFPDGLDAPPRLTSTRNQAYALVSLALAYQLSGQPGRAAPFYRREINIDEKANDKINVGIGVCNLSETLRLSGGLYNAETAARRALGLMRETENRLGEAVSLYLLGIALAHGDHPQALIAVHRSNRLFVAQSHPQFSGVATAYLAQAHLWSGDTTLARGLAARAWELAHVQRNERDFIRAARLQGTATLALGDLATADERLHYALTRARTVNYVQEELPALRGLAEVARQRGDFASARERLSEIWELAERGPYPTEYADALNALAQIERDSGNVHAAIQAATDAYIKAWCDGISTDGKHCYAYMYGLNNAKAHLIALNAPIPVLLPFDPAAHEPMPEVEIDPDDEFNARHFPKDS